MVDRPPHAAAQVLTEALIWSKILGRMYLGRQYNAIHLTFDSSPDLQVLMEALEGCDKLKVLELGYNPFGPEGIKALADVMKYKLQARLGSCCWMSSIGYSGTACCLPSSDRSCCSQPHSQCCCAHAKR